IMPPRKAPKTTPATTTNTTYVTNAQLQAMIDQGVAAALATCDAIRSTNGEDNHNSGTGVRRTEHVVIGHMNLESIISTCKIRENEGK
ncbi:hypothetical protein Tco_1088504, partial [Tanacetum coccineum]